MGYGLALLQMSKFGYSFNSVKSFNMAAFVIAFTDLVSISTLPEILDKASASMLVFPLL